MEQGLSVKLEKYKTLDPFQRAQLFKQIRQKYNFSYNKLAKKINKSPSYVANSIRLLDLPIAIKDGLLGGLISEGHARTLVSVNNLKQVVNIYKEVLKSHASVRETEQLVRDFKKNKQPDLIKTKLKKLLEKFFKKKFKKINVQKTSKQIKITLQN